jgi:hypothetical protein
MGTWYGITNCELQTLSSEKMAGPSNQQIKHFNGVSVFREALLM